MIFFRTFKLSFSIFFRYLPILPLILILSFVSVIPFMLIAFALSYISPGVSLIVIYISFYAFTILTTLIAIRFGLSALGEYYDTKIMDMVIISTVFGALKVSIEAILLVVALVGLVALGSYDIKEIASIFTDQDVERLMSLIGDGSYIQNVLYGTAIVVALLHVLLHVPYVAAVAGSNGRGRAYDFLWGFGSGFIFIGLCALIFIPGNYYFIVFVENLQGSSLWNDSTVPAVKRVLNGNFSSRDLTTEVILFLLAIAVLNVWFFCVQCAAAIQVFIKRRDRLEGATRSGRTHSTRAAGNARDLRQSRM